MFKHNKLMEPNTNYFLKDFFALYINNHAKHHNKTWEHDLYLFNKYLKNFHDKKMTEITKFDVACLHNNIGENSGHRTANVILQLLRVVYNYAIEYEVLDKNPAAKIKKYKEYSRDRFLQPEEVNSFLKALDNYEKTYMKNYVYLSLYTGARKSNVMSMKWSDINFKDTFIRHCGYTTKRYV